MMTAWERELKSPTFGGKSPFLGPHRREPQAPAASDYFPSPCTSFPVLALTATRCPRIRRRRRGGRNHFRGICVSRVRECPRLRQRLQRAGKRWELSQEPSLQERQPLLVDRPPLARHLAGSLRDDLPSSRRRSRSWTTCRSRRYSGWAARARRRGRGSSTRWRTPQCTR